VAAGAAAAHASAASGATGGRHGAVENEEHRMLLRNPPAATRPLAAHRAPHISLPLVDERHRPQTAAPRGQDSGDRRQLGGCLLALSSPSRKAHGHAWIDFQDVSSA